MKAAPAELPDKLTFNVIELHKADPDTIDLMLTCHFTNGNAGYRLIGFVLDDDDNPTDELVFEKVFGEVVPS